MTNIVSDLIEALNWYLEDDKRSVEMGILENIELRPADSALKKYDKYKLEQRTESRWCCANCGHIQGSEKHFCAVCDKTDWIKKDVIIYIESKEIIK